MSRKQLISYLGSQPETQITLHVNETGDCNSTILAGKKNTPDLFSGHEREIFYFRTKKYQYHSLPMVKNARPLVLIFAAGEPKLKALSWNSSCVYVHSSLRTPDRELSATSNNFSSDLHQFTEPLRLYVEWYQAKYMYLTKKKVLPIPNVQILTRALNPTLAVKCS